MIYFVVIEQNERNFLDSLMHLEIHEKLQQNIHGKFL